MAFRPFSVAGRSAATTATANHCGGALWNPSATKSIFVTQLSGSKTVATVDNIGLVRISARGTAGSTVTPVAQNDYSFDAVPPSGALLDLGAYTAQPTIVAAGAYIWKWNTPAAIGSGFILPFPKPLEIPAGAGLAIVTPPAVILQPYDYTFWWEE